MKKYRFVIVATVILLACGSQPIDPDSKLYKQIQRSLDSGNPFHWGNLRWYSELSFRDLVSEGDTVWATDGCVFVTFYDGGGYEVSRGWNEDCERLENRSTLPSDTLYFHHGSGTTDSIFIDSTGVRENKK